MLPLELSDSGDGIAVVAAATTAPSAEDGIKKKKGASSTNKLSDVCTDRWAADGNDSSSSSINASWNNPDTTDNDKKLTSQNNRLQMLVGQPLQLLEEDKSMRDLGVLMAPPPTAKSSLSASTSELWKRPKKRTSVVRSSSPRMSLAKSLSERGLTLDALEETPEAGSKGLSDSRRKKRSDRLAQSMH